MDRKLVSEKFWEKRDKLVESTSGWKMLIFYLFLIIWLGGFAAFVFVNLAGIVGAWVGSPSWGKWPMNAVFFIIFYFFWTAFSFVVGILLRGLIDRIFDKKMVRLVDEEWEDARQSGRINKEEIMEKIEKGGLE